MLGKILVKDLEFYDAILYYIQQICRHCMLLFPTQLYRIVSYYIG